MKYDLGQEMSDAPCGVASEEKKDKKYYPTLYFSHDEKIDLPEEGSAVIHFRKVESAENTRDPDDPKYRCELEVHSIETKGGDEGKVTSLKDGLRKALKVAEYEEEEED